MNCNLLWLLWRGVLSDNIEQEPCEDHPSLRGFTFIAIPKAQAIIQEDILVVWKKPTTGLHNAGCESIGSAKWEVVGETCTENKTIEIAEGLRSLELHLPRKVGSWSAYREYPAGIGEIFFLHFSLKGLYSHVAGLW